MRSVTRRFLKTEKSRSKRLGPTIWFRPTLPNRFAQEPAIPVLPGSDGPFVPGALKPKVWHWAAIAGVACGNVKQLRFTYCRPCDFQFGFTGSHPANRFT